MQENKLSPRLLWIAERVRENILLVDVGTDHAKLPVYLLDEGRISHAIASDIHSGPLEKAKVFVNALGYGGNIELVLTDGLMGIEASSPCDISICGMGGETIRNIIDAADFVKDENIHLLLQPMTDFAMLREYLAANGFDIADEDIVCSDNRVYQCLLAKYSGKKYSMTPIEYEVGAMCIEKRGEAFFEFVRRRINSLKVCVDGKRRASLDTSEDENLLLAYEKILEEKK